MKNLASICIVCALQILIFLSDARAEQYAYQAVCNPTQSEDVARVIQGRIYLALRADPTIAKFSVSIKVTKVKPTPVVTLTEDELLAGSGFTFNPADLAVGIGSDAAGHACFADALLSVNIHVTRKSGAVSTNQFTNPIRVPGAWATKGKTKINS